MGCVGPGAPKLVNLLPFVAKNSHKGSRPMEDCGTGKNPKGCHMSRPQNLDSSPFRKNTLPWSGLNLSKPKIYMQLVITKNHDKSITFIQISGLEVLEPTGRWMVNPCAQYRSFVACRTRQETQLEEAFDLGEGHNGSRFASFQQILPVKKGREKNMANRKKHGDFGGVLLLLLFYLRYRRCQLTLRIVVWFANRWVAGRSGIEVWIVRAM